MDSRTQHIFWLDDEEFACNAEGKSVPSLGQEDPFEENLAIHSSIRAWRIPMDRGAWEAYSPCGAKEFDTTEKLNDRHTFLKYLLTFST